ncbi:exocyst complex component SEC15A [Physcomitrium patens]|nr:exocyst complex component SEC15A-like [Physcomitrium patens]XP_024398734.1 exocyst complex component SEC15A-like [Physcomitrium patens]PNR37189.1 hypothetical protein PHYPA_020296 [Physcomitrium patens]|eukprot:XP_024398733.1 exocyst complex component SEC15A-like [Physcomitrella patens]
MSKAKRAGLAENGDGGMMGVDESALASAIGNGEDLAPFIRAAFENGKPETLIHQLKYFVKKKEVEIEDLCKLHYSEFIRAVDELRYVLVDADELKSGLAEENRQLQEVGDTLLRMLDALIQSHGTKKNIMQAIDSLKTCTSVVDLCMRVNEHVMNDSYYPALKALDIMERDFMPVLPARALRQLLERQIPVCRAHIERKVNKEFNDWLVHIRSASREIGQLSIGQASSARQREEDLRGRQRQAEEQSRSGSKELVYMLEMEDLDEDDSQLKFDLTPVYRAYHINTCLGMQDQFREYYFKNRQLQLNSDLQISTTQSFLESHQSYFAQLAGFFIVEDRVLRSAGGLMTSARTEQLWESAISKVTIVMEDQFSRMQDANHLLLVKDYVSLLGATLRRYGYQVGPLLEVLDTMRDKYHELLLADCRYRINDVLANDKSERMMMRKEYEYNMNVLAFHLQSVDVMPAFPYIAPFSATVPDCCRIVRSFIEDSVSFLAYGGHIDYYDLVKRYLDKLLVTVLNEALLRLVRSPILGVSHAMQIAANMTVLETACDYFAQHAAKLCGIPTRLVEGPHGALSAQSVLRNSQAVAHDTMIKLVKSKVDEVMNSTLNINWSPDDPPQGANDYLNDVYIYLQTIAETSQEILPPTAFYKVISGVLEHISRRIMETFLSEDVKRFNIYAVMGIETDLTILESFADDKYRTSVQDRVPMAQPLKSFLAEARQTVNLFMATQPDLYLNPVIRERNYGALNPKNIILIGEKFKDLPEKMFGGGRGGRVVAKKKLIDALIKRLKNEA